jgi:hypothetical protein
MPAPAKANRFVPFRGHRAWYRVVGERVEAGA